MILGILFAVFFVIMMVFRSPKMGIKRCWDAPPGESKVHTWVNRQELGSEQKFLVCEVCGQRPGEE